MSIFLSISHLTVCQDSNPTYFAERHQSYRLEVHPSPLFSKEFCSIFQKYYYLGKSPLEMFFVTIIFVTVKIIASCTEHSRFTEHALTTTLIFSKFDFPDIDVSFAACFMASDVSCSTFEKYAHMYVAAL